MKISQQELESIIKEELDTAIDEGWLDRLSARGQGAMSSAGQTFKAKRKELGGKLAGGKDVERGAHQGRSMRGQAAGMKKAKQTQVIVGNHLKKLSKDLAALGLGDQQSVKTAIGQLKAAVAQAAQGKTSEE
tara:strand:- start:5130 stop:5525 length:396 start_codon:yes stop_codon:yes gene_type:complete